MIYFLIILNDFDKFEFTPSTCTIYNPDFNEAPINNCPDSGEDSATSTFFPVISKMLI